MNYLWKYKTENIKLLVYFFQTFIDYYAQSYASYMRNEDDEAEEKKRLLEETISICHFFNINPILHYVIHEWS